MKEGDIAQHWASLSKLESDWNQYKQLRNQVINVLKTEKDQWQERRLKTMGKDSGLVWKILKNWFGWNKQQSSPCQLVSDGCMYSKPSDLARILNEQLIKKVKDHEANLEPPLGSAVNMITILMTGKNCNFDLQPIHPDQVSDILSALKPSSSSGLDTIDVKILKLGKMDLVLAITHIICP